MTGDGPTDARLREALAEVAKVAGDGADCPVPEQLWLSGGNALGARENEAVVLHLARCTSCGMAWRIARDLSLDAAGSRETSATRASGPPGWMELAAAAVLVIGVGIAMQFLSTPPGRTPSPYRTQEGAWLKSTVAAGEPLRRERFVLSWTAAPEGTLYDILVTNDRLELLARDIELEEPEFHVPVEALDSVAPGSRVFWQVRARLPDGRQVESETFISTVE